MSAARPKPRYDGKAKPPFGDFLDWLDRQLTEVLGASYTSLQAAIAGAVEAIDLSDIEADIADLQDDVADHETRISALEADTTKFRTTTYAWRGSSLSATAGATFYVQPWIATGGGSIGNHVDAALVWGRDGTIRNLRFMSLNSGTAATFSLTVIVAGAGTSVTLTGLSGGDVGTLHSDTTHTASISIGDTFAIQQVNGAGAISITDYAIMFDFVEPS